nr:hypothetical protein B0A51_02894 [Rachicladosporium sp. CCFEE 5018]OQO29868.1 hypothetical protein B0A51_02320 [Rachicladosporium sp. CCFEE 5018]
MGADKIQIVPIRRPPPSLAKSTRSPASSSTSESSEDALPAPVKKTRLGKPKVKTGCKTCKIRRVKCDETKPACDRCTSTGRTCDGYADVPPEKPARPDTRTVAIFRSIDTMQGDRTERRALDFFTKWTAPQLASFFDRNIWQQMVVQIGFSEPAIRHAMIALGSLSESREKSIVASPLRRTIPIGDPLASKIPQFVTVEGQDDPFALVHYNKAIARLAQRMRQADNATDIALLSCVLFVCIEMLRGEHGPAMEHFKAGMHIALGAAKQKPRTPYNQMQSTREQVMPFFYRLELLAMLTGLESHWKYPVEAIEVVLETFETIREARDSLVHLMNLSMRHIRSLRLRRFEADVKDEDLATQHSLLACLSSWKSAFEAVQKGCFSPVEQRSAHILEIHYITTITWVARSDAISESSTDIYLEDFERAVSLAETLQVAALAEETHSSTFVFDMEFVPHIYLIATKCRHPLVRRRAIAVLRSSFRREGLWDSNSSAAVAERIMQREEAGLDVADGTEWPGESARIHNAFFDMGSGINPHMHQLTYFSKPDGLQGGWTIEQETIVLQPE